MFTGDELESIKDPKNYNGRGFIEGGLTLDQVNNYIRSQFKENYNDTVIIGNFDK